MKLKGLTKLALSGAALAAVAATLGTSTYAWYVTNAKAKVDGINGASQAIGGDTILVAENMEKGTTDEEIAAWTKAHYHEDFQASLTLAERNITSPENGLDPVTPGKFTAFSGAEFASGTVYYELVDGAYVRTSDETKQAGTSYYTFSRDTKITSTTKWYNIDGEEETAAAYIQYDIWLYAKEDTDVRLKYTFNNLTEDDDFEAQTAYASDSPVGIGQTFVVNVKDALRMAYTVTDCVNNGGTVFTYTAVAADAEYNGNTTYYKAKAGVETPGEHAAADYEVATDVTDENFADYEATLYTRTSVQNNNWVDTEADSSVIVDVAACATKSTALNTSFDFSTTGDANKYYKNVLKKDAIVSTEYTGVTTTPTIHVTGGHETKLSFYIWLEGTDKNCFDSVAGQQFEFIYSFEA